MFYPTIRGAEERPTLLLCVSIDPRGGDAFLRRCEHFTHFLYGLTLAIGGKVIYLAARNAQWLNRLPSPLKHRRKTRRHLCITVVRGDAMRYEGRWVSPQIPDPCQPAPCFSSGAACSNLRNPGDFFNAAEFCQAVLVTHRVRCSTQTCKDAHEHVCNGFHERASSHEDSCAGAIPASNTIIWKGRSEPPSFLASRAFQEKGNSRRTQL